MTTPTLPDFDPAAALAGIDAEPSGPSRAARTRRSGAGGPSDRTDADRNETGPAATGSTQETDTGASIDRQGADDTRTRSETEADRRKNHPLSDIWGDG